MQRRESQRSLRIAAEKCVKAIEKATAEPEVADTSMDMFSGMGGMMGGAPMGQPPMGGMPGMAPMGQMPMPAPAPGGGAFDFLG